MHINKIIKIWESLKVMCCGDIRMFNENDLRFLEQFRAEV